MAFFRVSASSLPLIRSLLAVIGALAIVLLEAAPALAAPTWLAPVNLSAPGRSALEPQIAIDAAGGAVAVWRDSDNNTIQSASRAGGGAFSPPVVISGPGASRPQIAVNAAGEAVAVWQSSDGIIRSASRPPGGAFSTPVAISATGETGSDPHIAIDAAGDVVAVWRKTEAGGGVIQSALRPPGGAFAAQIPLSAAGGDASAPQVAIDAAGDAVAVWHRFNGVNFRVQSASRPAGGAFSLPAADLSAAGNDAFSAQVAIDDAGDAVAVWQLHEGPNFRIQSASRLLGGAFSPPVSISEPAPGTVEAQVAIDGTGEAVAVWRRLDGPHLVVRGASRPLGGAFSPAVDLSAAGEDALEPQVAIDGTGEAVAVWRRLDGPHVVVQGASRPVGGAFSPAVDLSAAGEVASQTQIAIDAAGNAVAVWTHFAGPESIVQAVSTARDTRTTVLCNPSKLVLGRTTACTATVGDAGGGPSAPVGTVKFASDAGGSFAGDGSCTLASAGAGQSSCQIAYTPRTERPTTHTITASSQATGVYLASDGSTRAEVQVAPNTTLKKKPHRKTTKRRAVFRFVADQPGSKFHCKLDRKRFEACRSPFKARVKPGRHTFRVRAVNQEGIADPTPAVYRWRVGGP